MTVDNGSTNTNHDSPSAWSPSGELAPIGEDEIIRHGTVRHGNGNHGTAQESSISDADAEFDGSFSLRELLHGSPQKFSELESTESKPQKQQTKTKAEPTLGPQPDSRSWSMRNLLGSFRSRETEEREEAMPDAGVPNATAKTKRPDSNTSSPLRHGSPFRGSPLRPGVRKLLTPQISFARIREEKDEKSRMVKTPEEMRLRDGITLPLIGQVKWAELKKHAIIWLHNPKNLVFLVWIIAVAVSGAILFMVMVGMLNGVLPKKSDRDLWFEISNQILNALFTLMALYNHPTRILHLVYLIRYAPADIIKLRERYCKDGLRKPHEWAHILVVVLLLHLNCIAQYALCGLNWGYRRSDRPALGVGITLFVSFGAAAAAGIYNTLSPLGKDYYPEEDGVHEEDELLDVVEKGGSAGHSSSVHPALFKLHNPKYNLLEKRKSFACRQGRPVVDPEWEGGLFKCHEEPTISVLSVLCFPCVMGFNYERLGFGNRYVHMVTFLLLVGAPFLVFSLAAVNIDNQYVRTSLGVTGYVLCIFSLLYGGFWRIKIRERYMLPAHAWCCKQPRTTDCFQWLFCPFCSLCQEVRTAESYDIRNDQFFVRSIHKARTSQGGSSPDCGIQTDFPSPSGHIQPLSGSPMVHIKDKDSSLLQDKPVDLTILFPPPEQTVDSVSSLPPTPHMAQSA